MSGEEQARHGYGSTETGTGAVSPFCSGPHRWLATIPADVDVEAISHRGWFLTLNVAIADMVCAGCGHDFRTWANSQKRLIGGDRWTSPEVWPWGPGEADADVSDDTDTDPDPDTDTAVLTDRDLHIREQSVHLAREVAVSVENFHTPELLPLAQRIEHYLRTGEVVSEAKDEEGGSD